MNYKLINCDSFIKKITKPDGLFLGNFCVDPYENCEFGCRYCDSSFEKTVYVKKNCIEILENELASIQNGRIIIGSVHDPYQNVENKYHLTKSILEILKKNDFSCHILTKSPLILRDISLIKNLDCLVTVSISSLDGHVVQIFEPAVPSPRERLWTVQILRKYAINAGLAMIPILPFVTDTEVENIVKAARDVDANYLLYKHLELKGDQKQYVRNLIETHYPHLKPKYDTLYGDGITPKEEYIQTLKKLFSKHFKNYNISDKILL